MSGPVTEALARSPELAARYEAFREAAHGALGAELVEAVRGAVAQVHGMGEAEAVDAPEALLSYARRMVFEHTAITDEEAAAVVGEIGEPGLVALSVVAALADAECRAAAVDLPGLSQA